MIKIIAIIIAVLIVVITATNTSISTACIQSEGNRSGFIVWVEVILAQPQLLSKKSTLTTKLFLEPVVIFKNM